MNNALLAVQRNEMSLRSAAKVARLSPAGILYHLKKLQDDPPNCRLVLLPAEETFVVELVREHAENGRWLTMKDLQDAVEILVSTFSDDRIGKLPFRDGCPGCRFCRDFEVRHRDSISFRKASKQEYKRYLCTNADTLTTYFARIERLIQEHHIDPTRIVNIGESGISADKDNVRTCRTKRYSVPKSNPDKCDVKFSNVNRITLLGCVHASGNIGRPIFVL